MNKILIMILFFSTIKTYSQTVNINDVAKIVKERNYLVLENAQMVYQANEAIDFARKNLLPQLNVWEVTQVAFSWVNVLGIVQDILPFLVPANWFRVKEQKLLFQVQKYGYETVWTNAVFLAKSLYRRIDHDEKLLSILKQHLVEMELILQIFHSREYLGDLPLGSSKGVEQKIFELKDDIKRLSFLILEEEKECNFILGFEDNQNLSIVPLDFDINNQQKYETEVVSRTALKNAPELKQFENLIKVLPLIKKEVQFSFLGTSSLSRGVAGGVFDDIPMQRGLGFSATSTFKILKSKEQVFKLQMNGLKELLKKQSTTLTFVLNTNLDYFSEVASQVAESEIYKKSLWDIAIMGGYVNPSDFVNAEIVVLKNKLSLHSLKTKIEENRERVDRLMITKDYSNPPNLEELIEQ